MSRDFWENRYQTGDMRWEKNAPSPGLVDFLAAHPNISGGDALVATPLAHGLKVEMIAPATGASPPRLTVAVPGCGSGNDVLAFARAGFDAHGFDFAPSAIALATEKTKTAGLKATFTLADFLHDEPPQPFDWLFEHTLFCAIKPEERDEYVRAALRWLKPGGHYLAVNYFIVEDAEGPPWPTTRAEQIARFSPHFELLADWLPRSYPSREGREWMFHWQRSLRTATVEK